MKIIANTILLCFVVFIACRDDQQIGLHFVSASFNGENWEGAPEISLDLQNDTLVFLGITNEQVLGFKLKFRGEGTYDSRELQSFYYTTVGTDVLTSSYIPDINLPAEVKITNYNERQNLLRGSFELFLVKNYGQYSMHPSDISVTDGLFNGTVNSISNP